jgi:hypothetical protein
MIVILVLLILAIRILVAPIKLMNVSLKMHAILFGVILLLDVLSKKLIVMITMNVLKIAVIPLALNMILVNTKM